jgi:hypothetical protein
MKMFVWLLLVAVACVKGPGEQRRTVVATTASGHPCRSAMRHMYEVLAADKSVIDPDDARKKLTLGFADACTRDRWALDAIECFASFSEAPDLRRCAEKLSPIQQRSFEDIFEHVEQTTRKPTRLLSPMELAKKTVEKYAFEAYPQWSLVSGKTCPDRLEELNEYIEAVNTKDPWGHNYKLICDPNLPFGIHNFKVMSSGSDGTDGTSDDIRSND